MIKSDKQKSQVNGAKENEDSKQDDAVLESEVPEENDSNGDGGAGSESSGRPEDELQKKEKEIESLTDMLKRRQADFENYKKRMAKSQEDYRKLAIKDFALDIININDDLLRAIDAASDIRDEQTKAFVDGVKIISGRIEEALKNYGIEEIDSLNKEFDPQFNEAVEIDMSGDVTRDTITAVHQKGFKLDDYVVRCAKVKVTKPLSADNSAGAKGKEDNNKSACAESGAADAEESGN